MGSPGNNWWPARPSFAPLRRPPGSSAPAQALILWARCWPWGLQRFLQKRAPPPPTPAMLIQTAWPAAAWAAATLWHRGEAGSVPAGLCTSEARSSLRCPEPTWPCSKQPGGREAHKSQVPQTVAGPRVGVAGRGKKSWAAAPGARRWDCAHGGSRAGSPLGVAQPPEATGTRTLTFKHVAGRSGGAAGGEG